MLVPNEAGAIRAALQQLIGDGALRRRLVQAARATVEQRFTESRMVDQTLQVYREQLHA